MKGQILVWTLWVPSRGLSKTSYWISKRTNLLTGLNEASWHFYVDLGIEVNQGTNFPITTYIALTYLFFSSSHCKSLQGFTNRLLQENLGTRIPYLKEFTWNEISSNTQGFWPKIYFYPTSLTTYKILRDFTYDLRNVKFVVLRN